jgi:hypothetical protein
MTIYRLCSLGRFCACNCLTMVITMVAVNALSLLHFDANPQSLASLTDAMNFVVLVTERPNLCRRLHLLPLSVRN